MGCSCIHCGSLQPGRARAPTCSQPVVGYFVTLVDPVPGSSPISAITLWPSCRRHQHAARKRAQEQGIKFLLPGFVNVADLERFVAWFHGDSGLCADDRARSVVRSASDS